MSSRQIRRREILKTGAAAAAYASFGGRIGQAAAPAHAQIDAVLRRATDAGEVPASSRRRQPIKGCSTRVRLARETLPKVPR